jgi:chemotaxis regulatin CheY-phosphate phosphatase CheZ
MPNSRIAEVLYDSETMLRLVDSELEELRDDAREAGLRGNNVGVLLAVMQRATSEIAQILCTLHTSREALQGVTLQEIHDSATKLGEVSTATELAATRMMDGLERAHTLVDRLDELDASGQPGDSAIESAVVRAKLRDELFAVMGSLQFQDITSQQLGHVAQMLRDIESRLQAISSLLAGGQADAAIISSNQVPTFSESASTRNSFERQATADALFWGDHSARVAH